MMDSVSYLTLSVITGILLLSILLSPILGVLLLIIVSLLNVFLEKILPIPPDVVVGLMTLIAFVASFVLRKRWWKRTVLDVPIVILASAILATVAVQSFTSPLFFEETFVQALSLITIMGMGLVIAQILETYKTVHFALQVFAATTIVIGLFGIVSIIFGISTIYIGPVELAAFSRWGGIQYRLGGVYEQPNTLATPFVLSMPLCLAFALTSKKTFKWFIWMGAAGVCAVNILLSQSRSAMLGTVVGMIVTIILFAKNLKFYRFILNVFIIIVVGLVVLKLINMEKALLERLRYTLYDFDRFAIWRETLFLAFQNPFGYGPRAKYLIGESLGLGQKSPHNVFLSFWIGFGIQGLIGISLLAVRPLRRLYKFTWAIEDKGRRMLSMGLISGLIGFWVHNFFHSIIQWMAIWIYFACVAAFLRFSQGEGFNERIKTPADRSDSFPAGQHGSANG